MLKTVFARVNSDVAQEALASIGVAAKDVTGELRPLGQIYDDVAMKWNTLSRAQRTYVAESLAGKFHITRMLALFDNYRTKQESMAVAERSLGSAIEENYKHQQSLESQMNRLSAAGTELSFILGEGGLKTAMSGSVGVLTTLLNGVSAFIKMNGYLKVSILATTAAIVAFGIAFNSVSVGSKVRLITTLGITFDTLVAKILSASAAAGTLATALALNPLVWIGGAIIGLTYFIGKQKQMKEEQEQLNKSFEETKAKLDAIIERSNKIGSPVPEDVPDLEALLENLDEYKNKIDEINENHKLQNPQGSESVKDLSKELKDRATQLGININQYKSLDEVLQAVNNKYNELSGALKNAKDNSIDYQGKIIESARNNQQEAQSIVDLVNEFESLNNVTNKNETQAKRYAEVLDILRSIFPQLAQGNNLNISLMKEEANARLKLTTETSKNAEVTIRSNLAKLQSDAETAIKAIAFIDAEIAKIRELSNARQSLGIGTLKYMEYLDESRGKASDTYNNATDASKKIRDILFSTPAPVIGGGGGSKVGSSSSSKSKETKIDIYLTDQYTQSLSDLDRQLAQSEGRMSKFTETSKEYRTEMDLQISLYKQKQTLTHTEAERLRAETSELQKKLSALGEFNKLSNDNKKIYNELAKQIHDNETKTKSLTVAWWDQQKAIDAIQSSIRDLISELLKSQKTTFLDNLKKQQEEVISNLNKIAKLSEQAFNYTDYAKEVRFDIEEIIASLNKLDEKFLKNTSPTTSTSGVRKELKEYKNDLLDFANEVENMTNNSTTDKDRLERLIKNEVKYAEQLQEELSEINNIIREKTIEYQKIEDALENQIKVVEEQYDTQIEAQNEKLRLLDEEIEKTDRLIELQKINDEISKVMNDKRFSYITSEGEEILTYDKGKVSELEKQRDEMILQYQREDLKQAIQSEIDRLEKAKNDKIAVLQDELSRTQAIHAADLEALNLYKDNLSVLYDTINADIDSKINTLNEIYQKDIENTEKRWDGIIEATANGTNTFDELMHGEDGWYKKSIRELSNYADNVEDEVARIRAYYNSIGGVSSSSSNSSGNSGSISLGSGSSSGSGWDNMNQSDIDRILKNSTFHSGGTIGENKPSSRIVDIVNKLFNVKPGEQAVKGLIGELMIPPKNILNNFIPNMQNLASNLLGVKPSQITNVEEKHFHFKDVTVKANNFTEFIKSFEHHIIAGQS